MRRIAASFALAAAACVNDVNDVHDVDVDADLAIDDDDGYEHALARLRDVEQGVPRVERGYVWWSERGEFGQRVEKRRQPIAGAAVEVVVDEACDVDAAPVDVDVGSVSLAPDGERVAFSADVDRTDRYGVFVKHTKSGRVRRVADDADFSVTWSKSGDLFFTRFGDDERPHSVWRVRDENISENVDAAPELVHEAADDVLVADVDDDSAVFFAGAGGVRSLRLGRAPTAVR